ncbi:MAG: T9SS type A sorting domain-containing protein [Chitinophagales bacterium]
MNKLNIFILCLLVFFNAQAQIPHGGFPKSLLKNQQLSIVPVSETPSTNIEALHQEDLIVDQIKDIPWRYGYIHYVDLGFENGSYDFLPNGDRIWRLKVKSSGAQTINLTFDNYRLVPGAELFVYNNDYSRILGSFTYENNKEHGFLTTDLIPGEEVTIELYEPSSVIGLSQLHLQRIVNGYRSLDYQKKYIGDSGSCNNNVICPEGDPWRDQIRAVGILLSQNNLSAGFCSGALINNTCNDGRAFFLTANHCGADDPTTVVGFNFQSSACNTNSGPYPSNTISGVTRRASNAGSDFMLLELSSIPPASYEVFYAGWDNSGFLPSSQVGIHHPAGDVKKITFDNQGAIQATYSGAQCWRILNWEDGTTEGGSSGSPLFNQDGNIIGQLYGGTASCSNNIDDYYGRFDVSWDNGSSASDELVSWLDPCNLGVSVHPGYDPNAIVLTQDIALNYVGAPSGEACASTIAQALNIRNRGTDDVTSVTINYGVDGALSQYTWNGLLTSNQSAQIPLDSLVFSTSGSYSYQAYISSSNLSNDENLNNDTVNINLLINLGVQVEINIATNINGGENYFEITDENDNIIEAEGPFGFIQNLSFSYCLPAGSYCINMYDDGGNGLTAIIPGGFDQGNYQLIVGGVEIVNTASIGSGHEYCFEYVEPIDTTGIRNLTDNIAFRVLPNPNQGSFVVQAEEEILKIEIVDLLGSVVYQEAALGKNSQIHLGTAVPGVYLIKLSTASGSAYEKFVIK